MKRYLSVAICSFVLSFIFCLVLIPILKKIKAGQNILSYVKEHKKKSGTPTMGGIAFVCASVFSVAIFSMEKGRTLIISLAIGIAFMIVGLLDDFLKKKHKENLGLKAWQKFLFQVLIAVFAGVYCNNSGLQSLYIPFLNRLVFVGRWMLPISIFVFLATANAVNLTDGLDGLASAVSVPFFACLGIILVLQRGEVSLASLCFSLVGALLAYLLFNTPPASVFMGDTGSLALGGFASAIAVLSGNALYIPILGACFVFSVISVVMQVIYYKATGGKRIFLMSPAHHHFQKKGYSESKISYTYFIITLLLGAISIFNYIL